MANPMSIRPASGKYVVRAGGAIVAESAAALELCEVDLPAVIYFPREDIAMALLEKTQSTTKCPKKGMSSYYAISTASGQIDDAAWSYEDPKTDEAQAIKGHIAFFTDRVTVERI
ncbi:DUF427 domain-containing protein [Rhodobacterales bacterium LSUCC0387]|nr:DUF427 domain-containing protein [Rhodobacterales bacterium LSUCC0374]MBF9040208.1 DUF427 domain-containing protein [Rhodobacterales bacterium LSUCC0387]